MAEPFDLSVAQIDLLLRYLAGRATPTEAEEVVRWMAMRPEHAQALATLERALEMDVPAAEPVPNADVVWNRLAARLSEEAAGAGEPRSLVLHHAASVAAAGSPFSRPRSWLRAAVVLLAAGAGFGLWQLITHRTTMPVAERPAALGYHEYATRPSERASFTLSDGTQVMLGVASRLRVPHDYGRTTRKVTLDGEAYFEVRHNPSQRFLVYSSHGITEDLGTRFDVRDYVGDTTAQVVVAEGKVALQAGNATLSPKPMVLTAGQLGHATAGGAVTVRGPIDVRQYLAWLEGRLVLRNSPLRDALPQLSRWYDLDFRLGDSTLADAGISATLTSQPIADALDLLAVTLGVRIERNGRSVTLYRQARPRIP